uniref:Zgc:112496 n=1 Tax=Fundulus heteroclitus TaxID=8078 RepID=A0A3Q2NPQ5_FUNHE
MSALFSCGQAASWRKVYGSYWDVLEARAKSNKPKLLQLDRWYQEELPALISSRPDKHLTLSELVKLMEWKLTRGKFRPRLQQLVASNAEATVQRCSRKAFSLLPDVQAAIAELSALKGVGPATASAVLAAGAPELAAFMSDEAMESVPGLKPIQYTAKHYALYLEKMTAQSAKLNQGKRVCIISLTRLILVRMHVSRRVVALPFVLSGSAAGLDAPQAGDVFVGDDHSHQAAASSSEGPGPEGRRPETGQEA